MLKMLIAVDGSAPAQRAIETAARFQAHVQGLEAIIVNVRQWPLFQGELSPSRYQEIEDDQIRRQSDLLESAAAAARRCGLGHVSTLAEVGEPAAEIARVAQAREVDQIMIGTHGRGAFGNLLMGSVAQRVVHHATVPVVLVK